MEMTYMIFLSLMVPSAFLYGLSFNKSAYHRGYTDGQIDAINDRQNYQLLEFSDGTRDYYHKDNLSTFNQEFKIIK